LSPNVTDIVEPGEAVPAGNVKQLKLPSGVFHFLLQTEQQEILLSRKVVVLE